VTNSKVSTFTSKGTRAPGTLGTGKLASLGHFDPTTGRVYQHPRVQADGGIGGRAVRVTNSGASLAGRNARTASLGMGAVGQVGRNRDVGAKGET
jgi:hypothetical protein